LVFSRAIDRILILQTYGAALGVPNKVVSGDMVGYTLLANLMLYELGAWLYGYKNPTGFTRCKVEVAFSLEQRPYSLSILSVELDVFERLRCRY
jgi:hypothetical protein